MHQIADNFFLALCMVGYFYGFLGKTFSISSDKVRRMIKFIDQVFRVISPSPLFCKNC